MAKAAPPPAGMTNEQLNIVINTIVRNQEKTEKQLKSLNKTFSDVSRNAKKLESAFAKVTRRVMALGKAIVAVYLPKASKIIEPILEFNVVSARGVESLHKMEAALASSGERFLSTADAARMFADIAGQSFTNMYALLPNFSKEVAKLGEGMAETFGPQGTQIVSRFLGSFKGNIFAQEAMMKALRDRNKEMFEMQSKLAGASISDMKKVWQAWTGEMLDPVAQRIVDFNKLQSAFRAEWQQLLIDIVKDNGPELKTLFDTLKNGVRAFFDFIRNNRDAINDVFKTLGTVLQSLATIIKKVWDWFEKLSPSTQKFVVQGVAAYAILSKISGVGLGSVIKGVVGLGAQLLIATTQARSLKKALAGAQAAQLGKGAGGVGRLVGGAGKFGLAGVGIAAAGMAAYETGKFLGGRGRTWGQKAQKTTGGKLAGKGMWSWLPGMGSDATVAAAGKADPKVIAMRQARQKELAEQAKRADEQAKPQKDAAKAAEEQASQTKKQATLTDEIIKAELKYVDTFSTLLSQQEEFAKLTGDTSNLQKSIREYTEQTADAYNKANQYIEQLEELSKGRVRTAAEEKTLSEARALAQKAQLEYTKAQVREMKAALIPDQLRLDLNKKILALHKLDMQMMENVFGTAALAAGAMVQYTQGLEHQRQIQESQLATIQKQRAELERTGGDRQAILALVMEEREQQAKIKQTQLEQLQTVKKLRDGYIEAIQAQTFGLGAFSKLLISREQNMGLAQQMGAVRKNLLLGVTQQPGAPQVASYRYSAYGGFERTGGGAFGRRELERRQETTTGRTEGFQRYLAQMGNQLSRSTMNMNTEFRAHGQNIKDNTVALKSVQSAMVTWGQRGQEQMQSLAGKGPGTRNITTQGGGAPFGNAGQIRGSRRMPIPTGKTPAGAGMSKQTSKGVAGAANDLVASAVNLRSAILDNVVETESTPLADSG